MNKLRNSENALHIHKRKSRSSKKNSTEIEGTSSQTNTSATTISEIIDSKQSNISKDTTSTNSNRKRRTKKSSANKSTSKPIVQLHNKILQNTKDELIEKIKLENPEMENQNKVEVNNFVKEEEEVNNVPTITVNISNSIDTLDNQGQELIDKANKINEKILDSNNSDSINKSQSETINKMTEIKPITNKEATIGHEIDNEKINKGIKETLTDMKKENTKNSNKSSHIELNDKKDNSKISEVISESQDKMDIKNDTKDLVSLEKNNSINLKRNLVKQEPNADKDQKKNNLNNNMENKSTNKLTTTTTTTTSTSTITSSSPPKIQDNNIKGTSNTDEINPSQQQHTPTRKRKRGRPSRSVTSGSNPQSTSSSISNSATSSPKIDYSFYGIVRSSKRLHHDAFVKKCVHCQTIISPAEYAKNGVICGNCWKTNFKE